MTYSANSLPAWISLAGNTLSLTPTLAQIGEHDIVVKVSDDTNETTQTIRVTVREANIAPVISNQTFSIAENSFNGTLVGTLTATDANAGDSLNYEVVGGNQLGIFALSGDGKLTVANNTHLDYEAHQSVTLRVRVSDNGSPALSGEADVTVTITDIDDEAPTITLSSADPITIKEGESFTVPTATCHDNQSDCTMTVTNPVNIDVAGVYYIIYKAVDEAGNQTIAQVLVTVLSKIIPPATNPSLPGAPTQPAPLGQPSTSRPMTLAWPNQSNDETGAPIIENKTASAPFKLKGKQKITLNLNDDYWEPGVECAETTSCIVEIIGKVDTSRAGTYTITYKLADSGYTLTRTVIVHDPEAAQAATDQSQTDNRAGESWWQSAANLAIKLWYIWPIIVAVLWLIVARHRRRRGEVIDDMGFSSRRSRI